MDKTDGQRTQKKSLLIGSVTSSCHNANLSEHILYSFWRKISSGEAHGRVQESRANVIVNQGGGQAERADVSETPTNGTRRMFLEQRNRSREHLMSGNFAFYLWTVRKLRVLLMEYQRTTRFLHSVGFEQQILVLTFYQLSQVYQSYWFLRSTWILGVFQFWGV